MKRILSHALAMLVLLASIELSHHSESLLSAEVAADSGANLQPLVTTSELVVGRNRFAFGLLQANTLVERAKVLVRIYSVDGAQAIPAGETNALYHRIGTEERGGRVHRHRDGTRHVHDAANAVRGLYVTEIAFPRVGAWGVEIQAQQPNGSIGRARFMAAVSHAPRTPAVGSAAPRSRNLIITDVKHLRQIDTSSPPDPRLHGVRIADAIAQKKPQLIVFATPQFCTSRMCGPVVDVVRSLLPTYGKRMAFIHQEIWQDFAEKKMFRTVEEWRLETEPWIFVVDGAGIIRAKFEGLVASRELQSALEQTLNDN